MKSNEIKYFPKLSSQDVLILVHPDAIFEKYGGIYPNSDQQIKQHNKLVQYIKDVEFVVRSKQYKIYTLFMYSPEYAPTQHLELYQSFYKFLESKTIALYDKMQYGKEMFNKYIVDYLIDNPDVQVYFGGGYTNLCVKQSQDLFCQLMNGIYDGKIKTLDKVTFNKL